MIFFFNLFRHAATLQEADLIKRMKYCWAISTFQTWQFKITYAAFGAMDYYLLYNPFALHRPSLASRYSMAISTKYIRMPYIS